MSEQLKVWWTDGDYYIEENEAYVEPEYFQVVEKSAYDALAERLAECEAALEFYADKRNWLSVKDEADDEIEGLIHSSDLEAISLWDYGGKQAREYFKKWKPAQ